MTALIVALLVVSQAGIDASATPPPVDPAAEVILEPPAPARLTFQQGAPYVPQRAARLFEREPQVSGGALLGRVALSAVFGIAGRATGELAFFGLFRHGQAAGGAGFLVAAIVVGYVLTPCLTMIGIALGSALFGKDFARDFQEALPVAGIAAGASLLLALGLQAMRLNLLLAFGIAIVTVAIATPLIVQAMKPAPRMAALRDAAPVELSTAFSF